MPKRVTCREAMVRYIDALHGWGKFGGPSPIAQPRCDWSATDATEDKVLKAVEDHVRDVHDLKPEDLASDVRDSIHGLIVGV